MSASPTLLVPVYRRGPYATEEITLAQVLKLEVGALFEANYLGSPWEWQAMRKVAADAWEHDELQTRTRRSGRDRNGQPMPDVVIDPGVFGGPSFW